MEDCKKNSILFTCSGAIDFTEDVYIELSLEYKEGFKLITPIELLKKISKIKHMQYIFSTYFYKICGRMPHISDINDNIPESKRFTKVYYKCYRKFSHSHKYGEYTITNLELDQCIEYIKSKNLCIIPPTLPIEVMRHIQLDGILN